MKESYIFKNTEKYADTMARRENYLQEIMTLTRKRLAECAARRQAWITPEKLAENPEYYRRELYALLGWPMNTITPGESRPVPAAKREEYENENSFCRVSRLTLEVLPGLDLPCLLFIPKDLQPGEKLPGLLSQHGGLGTPELCSGITGDSANYNDMTMRVAEHRAVILAPQLLLWKQEDGEPAFSRASIDSTLRMTGSSIAALEVYALMRGVDYLASLECVDENRLGMIGLSYGGYYTLMTAACDTRLKASLSAASFNERGKVPWADWTYEGQAEKFYDAELAGLVAPRRLILEAGSEDALFPGESAQEEFERVPPFFAAQGAEDKITFRLFQGPHELYKGDEDILELVKLL